MFLKVNQALALPSRAQMERPTLIAIHQQPALPVHVEPFRLPVLLECAPYVLQEHPTVIVTRAHRAQPAVHVLLLLPVALVRAYHLHVLMEQLTWT